MLPLLRLSFGQPSSNSNLLADLGLVDLVGTRILRLGDSGRISTVLLGRSRLLVGL